jgi:hypothetical protein
MDGEFPLEDHLLSLAGRTPADHQRLTRLLVGRSWPGGEGDRSDPIGLEWVKRWRAVRAEFAIPGCECAAGRCSVCN